jgi:FkbM family methyltransferase
MFELIAQERPASKAVRAACTSPEKIGTLSLKIPVVDGVARTELAGTETGVDEPEAEHYETQAVPGLTLDQILEQHEAPNPDFISIDVEGTELDVLKGLDLQRWRPRLLLVEDKWVYFDKHRYLVAHGYRLVKRTGPNSWYVPAGAPFVTPLLEQLNIWRKFYYGIWPRKLRKAR